MLNAIADPWWGNIVINIIYNDNFFLPQFSKYHLNFTTL